VYYLSQYISTDTRIYTRTDIYQSINLSIQMFGKMPHNIPTEIAVKAKSCPTLHSTVNLIQKLPQSVSQHIYDEYETCKKICRRFIQLLLLHKYGDENTPVISQPPSIVYWNELVEIMLILWKHPSITEYLCKKMSGFHSAYHTYYCHIQNPAKSTEEKMKLITQSLTYIFSQMK
jgi:hypothetical protein